MLHWYWEVKFIVISLILTRVISTIFYILRRKNLLVQLMTPICDQSFKINRTEVNELLKGSMNQWVYLQYRTPIHKLFFLRFSVNWPQLLGIFVCTGVNLVASFLIILNLYRRSVTLDVKPQHIMELIQTEFCLKVNQMLHTATKLLEGENDS